MYSQVQKIHGMKEDFANSLAHVPSPIEVDLTRLRKDVGVKEKHGYWGANS